MYMKRFFLFLALLCCLQTLAFAQLPSVSVETLSGEKINASSLVDGKTPLVISFWSVTCKPCIQELDAIKQLLRETMVKTCGAVFAEPRFSTDNAMGVAVLAHRALEE